MIRFERLAEHHLASILEIEQESHGAPWSERGFRNELDHPYGRFWVAIEEGSIVGYGGIWLVIDEAHVTTVTVHSNHRRKGIGRKLCIQLLEEAKELGMTCSTLEVRAGNTAAIELYLRLGFSQSGLRRKYYPDNDEDAVVMWLFDLQGWSPPK